MSLVWVATSEAQTCPIWISRDIISSYSGGNARQKETKLCRVGMKKAYRLACVKTGKNKTIFTFTVINSTCTAYTSLMFMLRILFSNTGPLLPLGSSQSSSQPSSNIEILMPMHCDKCITCIISWNSHNLMNEESTIVIPIFIWENS